MHTPVSSVDNFCAFAFFDCFATKEETLHNARNTSSYTNIRETTVYYQQPHLVEPMKLTVYEDLPSTPRSATLSRPFFSRTGTASRASSRLSLFSLRQRVSRQHALISRPVLQANSCNDLTLRRRGAFRPLELSIYVEKHRLSDLPAFDRLSFTDFGELKNYDRILSRPQSALLPPLQNTPLLALQEPPKSTSMYEMRPAESTRPQTSYSITTVSRPASEYDALHSHPVSWASLPGLSVITSNHKVEKPVAILTPMEEEFPADSLATSARCTPPYVSTDKLHGSVEIVADLDSNIDLAAPAPVVSRGIYRRDYRPRSMDDVSNLDPPVRRSSYRQSIGQWLATRQRAGSTSTVATSVTITSFAEHRRTRDGFYQLGQHAQVAAVPTAITPELVGLSDASPFHRRTETGSTIASTVDTDILSDDERRFSIDTCTPISDTLRSPSGTIKSITSPGGRKVVTSTIPGMGLHTPMRGQVYVLDEENPYLDDIRGRLRTPGIGMAF